MNELDRKKMMELVSQVFNYSIEELEDWSDTNIFNAYLSAQKAIDDFEEQNHEKENIQ